MKLILNVYSVNNNSKLLKIKLNQNNISKLEYSPCN